MGSNHEKRGRNSRYTLPLNNLCAKILSSLESLSFALAIRGGHL